MEALLSFGGEDSSSLLEARHVRNVEVRGSTPLSSTLITLLRGFLGFPGPAMVPISEDGCG